MSMRLAGPLFGLVAVLVSPASASAADKLVLAPAPDWVQAIATPAGVPGDDAAIRILLLDQQLNFRAGGTAIYVHSVSRIQTPQGLAASNALSLVWRPDSDVLTVHHIRVIHQGQTRELAVKPEDFTILRRENNLELAALDGVLTATMQPEALEVGDTIDIAYTLERRDPVLAGHGERMLIGGAGVPIRAFHLSAQWDKGQPMRWRPTDLPATPKVVGQRLTLDVADVQPLVSPAGAPARFQLGRLLSFSDFRSWEEVAALFAPLFTKARTLDAASPLKAEVARIRAASNDPVKQAEAALELAQDQVRYVAISLNDGNLVPASADATWQRRYGDCKAKTALLLALLDGLGIQAEPVAANVILGDGMDERLPGVGAFNHVLVRATIAGNAYWLDGTRMGDTSLAQLRVPAFGWVLPLRARGATLERLMPPPADVPDTRSIVKLDASAGLYAPAKAHVEVVMTGDLAFGTSISLANLTPAARDQALRDYFRGRYDSITPARVSASYDKATGEETMVMDGTDRMDWWVSRTLPGHEVNGATFGWRADFTRADGPYKDAPFAVNYPSFTRDEEEVILPRGGRDFTGNLAGDEDRTVAGRHFLRRMTMRDGVIHMTAETRSLVPEFPAAEAAEAEKALRAMADVTIYLRPPQAYRPTDGDEAAFQAETPKDAAGYVLRGESFGRQKRWQEALDAYTQALKLDTNNVPALAGQAQVFLARGEFAAAKEKSDKILAEKPDDRAGLRIAAGVLIGMNDYAAALPILDKVIAATPGDAWLVGSRGAAKFRTGDIDGALGDYDQALKLDPTQFVQAYSARYLARLHRDGREKAAAEGDALLAAYPDDPRAIRLAAEMFSNGGRTADAARLYDGLVAKTPDDPSIWTARSAIWPADQRDKAVADVEKALAIKPDAPAALSRLAVLRENAGDYPGALDLYRKLRDLSPPMERPWTQITIARVLARSGDKQGATKLFAEVRGEKDKGASMLNSLCYEAAVANFALDQALADCRASLALQASEATQDSLGFVLLRMRRFDEAIAAYNEGLKKMPARYETEAAMHYGRGLALIGKGRNAEGEADLARARDLSRIVETTFRRNGVIP